MIASVFPRQYRAYDFDNKVMLYEKDLIERGLTISPDGLPHFHKVPFFNIVIMWYSGQNAKDGTRVYEGDICEMAVLNEFGSATKCNAIMRYNKPTNQFILQMPAERGNQFLSVAEVSVIGNEFENPELLKLVTLKKTNG